MNIILYKSTTCPQCRVVKMKLDKKGIPYEERLTDKMTPAELAAADVKGIPTVFVDGEKMTDIGVINKWLNTLEVNNG